MKVRKAVIPAAGWGVRWLPLTKVVPKELLPVGGKPLIQHVVEEVAASGLETVILVLTPGKTLLQDYFCPNPKLQACLLKRNFHQEAALLENLSSLINLQIAWQDEPRGLGHAIGCTRSLVGDEPFVVLLPDVLVDAQAPCTRQLVACQQEIGGCVVATRRIADSEVNRFGILEVTPGSEGSNYGHVMPVASLKERPALEDTDSRYGIFGRYVLDPAIFGCIEKTPPGRVGEIQLTDALMLYSLHNPVYAYCFEGTHHDVGDQWGFLKATVDYGLRDPALRGPLLNYLHNLEPSVAINAATGLR